MATLNDLTFLCKVLIRLVIGHQIEQDACMCPKCLLMLGLNSH